MPSLDNLPPVPKRDLNIFYVLDTSAEKSDFKDLRKVLLYMRREFGSEVFRNPSRMASIINDLSPTLRRDANILRHLGERGLLRELEQADNNNRTRVTFKVRHWLENEFFMREEQAAYYAQALELLYHPEDNLSAVPKIDTLNHLVEDTCKIWYSEAKKWDNVNFRIAALEFNANCRWLTFNGPEDLDYFVYDYLEFGGTESNLGAVLWELNSKLSRRGWVGFCAPKDIIVIFMTDGHATDNYMEALSEIRENRCFRMATKIGFTLSDNADMDIISSLVGNEMTSIAGNKAAVFQHSDMDRFKKLMSKYFNYRTWSMMAEDSEPETRIYYDKDGEIHFYDHHGHVSTGADIVKMATAHLDEPDDDDEW